MARAGRPPHPVTLCPSTRGLTFGVAGCHPERRKCWPRRWTRSRATQPDWSTTDSQRLVWRGLEGADRHARPHHRISHRRLRSSLRPQGARDTHQGSTNLWTSLLSAPLVRPIRNTRGRADARCRRRLLCQLGERLCAHCQSAGAAGGAGIERAEEARIARRARQSLLVELRSATGLRVEASERGSRDRPAGGS